MKILTKLMLASAVMVTSGFASDISGGIEVAGTHNQNEDASVAGLIEVKSGGTFNNAAKLTFGTGGGIETAAAVEATVEEYEAAYDTYCTVNSVPDSEKVCPVGWYPAGSIIGTLTVEYGDGPMFINDLYEAGFTSVAWELFEDYKVKNVGPLNVDLASLPNEWRIRIFEGEGLGGYEGGSGTFSWNNPSPQSEETFIEELKAIVGDLSKPAGVFNNAAGHLELTAATGTNFNALATGGEATMTYANDENFGNLTLGETGKSVKVNYTYEDPESWSAPAVDADKYIKVTYTAAKGDAAILDEVKEIVNASSVIELGTKTPVKGANHDGRKTFPGILADSVLNLTENKLATNHIPTAIKGYNATNSLDVDAVINIQFEGSDNLLFANGGTNKVIEFAGVNSAYTGEASFGDTITKVHANGANTLPKNLASDMNSIVLEIDGENTINNGGSTAIKSLKVNSAGKLIVAAGTTLTVGASA